jgi:hypothetical protein
MKNYIAGKLKYLLFLSIGMLIITSNIAGAYAESDPSTGMLSGPDTIQQGKQICLNFTLTGVKEISAEDITIKYDKERFDFISADPINESTIVLETVNDASTGTLRIIAASFGADNAISGTEDILKLVFTSKMTGTADFSATKVSLANAQGEVYQSAAFIKPVRISADKRLIKNNRSGSIRE